MDSRKVIKRGATSGSSCRPKKQVRLDFASMEDEGFVDDSALITSSHPHVSESSLTPVSIKLSLGNERFLTCDTYKGQLKIHIRQYQTSNEKSFPTKMGVSMSPLRFATFKSKMDELNEGVCSLREKPHVDERMHLGGAWYATVKTGFLCVDIRRFFYPEGQLETVPTRSGIALRLPEWDELRVQVATLLQQLPTLNEIVPCYFSPDHANQMVALACSECNHQMI